MPLKNIDHYLLRVQDIEKSKWFYTEVLGLKVGYRPPFSFFGYWLYLSDKPSVHLVQATQDKAKNLSNGSSALSHIAFHADDFSGMINHLDKLNIRYDYLKVPEEEGAQQLFITDPDGLKIELNFPNYSEDKKEF